MTSEISARAAHAGTKAEKLRLLPPWPEAAQISDVPLMKEVRRGNTNPAGHILSAKMGRKLQYRSPNERAFLILAEVDANVVRIADRPTYSTAMIDGRADGHYPDYAILVDGVAEVHEVKSDDQYAHQDLVRRLGFHQREIEARGCIYSVALRSALLAEPRYGRAARLWPFSTDRISPEQSAAVKTVVQRGPTVVGDLMAELRHRLGSAAPPRRAVLGMAARGEILTDLTEPVGVETIVRPYDPLAMPERLIAVRRPLDDLLERYKVAA
ncbi:hypothetical protein [uncultured Sphingomonas sp.]|uniref:hypothetical protein n=1 Tax=uncultured Sphingomonas sp. TaxID=158754 RepID=UPI0025FE4BCE|nr:hypothetical protein [uncultured Sphingomonas sp.]